MTDTPAIEEPADDRLRHAPVTTSRRSICGGLAIIVLPLTAGCSTLSDLLDGDPGEVTVFNNTESVVTATITVVNLSEDETVLSETTDIDASQAAKFDEIFDSATQYQFEIETEGGLSNSYEWELPSTAHYLYATVHPDSIEFEENEP